ncbi:hypothetical protein J6590_063171 [Homalodisca vitripennis]|nr:hypothetical protein J6590_063171 [Homalodisca vitripennis]
MDKVVNGIRDKRIETLSIVTILIPFNSKSPTGRIGNSGGSSCFTENSLYGCLAEMWQLRVTMAERSRTLDFESELEIAQVHILSVTIALFISTIDLVLYRLSPLFCLIRSSHRPVAHEDGQNKA